MLKTLQNPLSRWFLACTVLAAAAAFSNGSVAQQPPGQVAPPAAGGPPPAPTGNPICQRLEAQLATIDRGSGTGDPAKDEQIRRYQEAATKQQSELDRVTQQAKRQGC